jgi:hypothetical protein
MATKVDLGIKETECVQYRHVFRRLCEVAVRVKPDRAAIVNVRNNGPFQAFRKLRNNTVNV